MYPPPPPTVYGRSNTSLASMRACDSLEPRTELGVCRHTPTGCGQGEGSRRSRPDNGRGHMESDRRNVTGKEGNDYGPGRSSRGPGV